MSGTSGTISTLTASVGADLFTNGNQLNVLGATVIDGSGTTIRVDPHTTPGTASLTSLSLNLNNGGGLTMAGGIASISGGQLEINAGSVLGGHGTINVGDSDLVAEQAFDNSALLQPQGNAAAPQTLTIHAIGLDTIDLDGDSETGVVDVDNALANTNADTVTLVIDGPLADAFGGVAGAALQIGQRDTLTFTKDFTIAGPAAISLNGGNNVATLNGTGKITSITGTTFTATGAAVITNDMAFSGTANTITLNASSSLELGGTVTIPDASALVVSSSSSELIISGSTTVTEAAGDFNWDGSGTATTTVKGSGQLTLNVNRVDTTDDLYGGTLNLVDDGDVSVDNTANVWTMAGTATQERHRHVDARRRCNERHRQRYGQRAGAAVDGDSDAVARLECDRERDAPARRWVGVGGPGIADRHWHAADGGHIHRFGQYDGRSQHIRLGRLGHWYVANDQLRRRLHDQLNDFRQ